MSNQNLIDDMVCIAQGIGLPLHLVGWLRIQTQSGKFKYAIFLFLFFFFLGEGEGLHYQAMELLHFSSDIWLNY